MGALVLGPMLRYVDTDSATVWVETADAATVTVTAGEPAGRGRGRSPRTATTTRWSSSPGWRRGAARRTASTSTASRSGREPGSPYPPPVIATLDPGKPLRMALRLVPGQRPPRRGGQRRVRRRRAARLRAAHGRPASGGRATSSWPDLVLFLGDQVYADETSDAMREFIASRRGLEEPPGEELKDYEEYAHLYQLAWCDPANRWLLSTLPSAMIFDDHDIRDDWNTSWTWREEMEATPWWHAADRLRAGVVLGLPAPGQPRPPPTAPRTSCGSGSSATTATRELDLTDAARRAGRRRRPRARQLPVEPRPRLRHARRGWSSSTPGPRGCCEPEHRSILDADEMALARRPAARAASTTC